VRQRFDWQLGELTCGSITRHLLSHRYQLKNSRHAAAEASRSSEALDSSKRAAALSNCCGRVSNGCARCTFCRRATRTRAEWFALPDCRPADAPFTREDMRAELEIRKIAHALLFGGNLSASPLTKIFSIARAGK